MQVSTLAAKSKNEKLIQRWKNLIDQGIKKGKIEHRVHYAEVINRTIEQHFTRGGARPFCRLLYGKLKYFEAAAEILKGFIQDNSTHSNSYWIALASFTLQICSRILHVEDNIARNERNKDDVKMVTLCVCHLLCRMKAQNIHFTCAQYIWNYTWKAEKNGQELCEGDYAKKYNIVGKLKELLKAEHTKVRQMAAGALWGLCGNRGTNPYGQKAILQQRVLEDILRLIVSNEKKRGDEWEKEMFVGLGVITAATTHIPRRPETNFKSQDVSAYIVGRNGIQILLHVLGHAHHHFGEKKYPITAERMAKCLEALGQILLTDDRARKVFLDPKISGTKYIFAMLQSPVNIVKNSAVMTLTNAAMFDAQIKKLFGSVDKILKILIQNANMSDEKQESSSELKFNSALALSALCYLPPRRHGDYEARAKNQKRIFELGGLKEITKFLEPMKDLEKNSPFYVLPLKVGLRMATDITYGNPTVQKHMIEQMIDCIICNRILAKDYGVEIDVLAIELLCAMAKHNKEAQNIIIKHNVNHFLMGTILKKENLDKRVTIACAKILHVLGENNPPGANQKLLSFHAWLRSRPSFDALILK
mmetsp:Transcript_14476/g.20224  ORF Transcript_14476/g.20224 Transcript_14476/m.20224 type:complete len:590 (-) Transcript_14476:961-2730(-)